MMKYRSQKKLNSLKRERLEETLSMKSRELASANLYKTEKNQILNEIYEGLEKLRKKPDLVGKDLRKIEKFVCGHIDRENEWKQLNKHFNEVSPGFFEKLKNQQPKLTQNELKHSAYLKMSLSNKEIARLLGINHSSVHMAQYRLKKKLNLAGEQSLVSFIMAI